MLERYLSPQDFLMTFGMNQQAFANQPAWKQTQLKQSKGLG
jgi:Villin headpiece domain